MADCTTRVVGKMEMMKISDSSPFVVVEDVEDYVNEQEKLGFWVEMLKRRGERRREETM